MGCLEKVGAIHVGNEAAGQGPVTIMPQCLVGHHRSEIGAANPNINNIADAFTGVPNPITPADAVREVRHFVKHCMNFGYRIFAVDQKRFPLGARRATWSTARFSVTLILSPWNIALICSPS